MLPRRLCAPYTRTSRRPSLTLKLDRGRHGCAVVRADVVMLTVMLVLQVLETQKTPVL
jgi:hypothetical protein